LDKNHINRSDCQVAILLANDFSKLLLKSELSEPLEFNGFIHPSEIVFLNIFLLIVLTHGPIQQIDEQASVSVQLSVLRNTVSSATQLFFPARQTNSAISALDIEQLIIRKNLFTYNIYTTV